MVGLAGSFGFREAVSIPLTVATKAHAKKLIVTTIAFRIL